MTLTTHAVVGAAVASAIPSHPVLGFVGGFLSHFALDSVPHWSEGRALLRSSKEWDTDHSVRVMRLGGDLLKDVAIVSLDSLIGFTVSILILWGLFNAPLYTVLLGAFAAQVPDGLQFLYFMFKPRFMLPLQKFHERIQTEYDNVAYLGIEAGLILLVLALGMLGAFVV